MKDTHLLPYILPNVFSIAAIVTPQQFASLVLPSLKPLFTIKEPPQNMLTLLDNLNTLQEKTEKSVFRERSCDPPLHVACVSAFGSDVLPLVYNALESEHAAVRHMASFLLYLYLAVSRFKNGLLGLYPGCARALIMPKSKACSSRGLRWGSRYYSHEYLTDYTTACLHQDARSVRESSYSRYILKHDQYIGSGKCPGYFASPLRLTKVQSSLTQKLVPLLSKIRTKEPAVTVRFGSLSFRLTIIYVEYHRWRL